MPATGADSIWIADRTADGSTTLHNPPTRRLAEAILRDLLLSTLGRVLVGVDFSLALPRGAVRAAGLGQGWADLWAHLAEHLVDDEHNRNNRWEVAAALNRRLGAPHFWGVPAARATAHLTVRRPTPTLPHLRHCETELRSADGRAPKSTWQLLGAGSVGSQALTGIPVLHRLRHHPGLAGRARVWPFETGLEPDPAPGDDTILFAEVWPSTVPLDPADHEVKDARQVLALARHLAVLDEAGELARRFAPPLDPDIVDDVIREEGWVLH